MKHQTKVKIYKTAQLMKKILILLFITISYINNAQENIVKEAFLEKWKNSKEYLMEMAQTMPEDKYEFQPTERQMTFRAQLLHIQENMDWLGAEYFNMEPGLEIDKEKKYSKVEIISMLSESFDNVYEAIEKTSEENIMESIEFFAGPMSRMQMLNLLQDHVTHHRGQLVVYLNLCDIDLPRYSGW